MNNDRIEAALREIEASLPTGKAQVRFDVYGGGADESFIRGSRVGIARFGVRLIRASLREEQRKSINGCSEVESALEDIVHPSSDVKFDWIEVSDDLEGDPQVRARTQRTLKKWSMIGWITVVLALLIFLLWRLR
jgi:hypothetical protein